MAVILRPGALAQTSRASRHFAVNIVAQRFIERRSPIRWAAHWFLAWGCMIAAAVTFPYPSVGYASRRARTHRQSIGRSSSACYVGASRSTSLIAPLAFNVLDICAVMVLIGVFTGNVAARP